MRVRDYRSPRLFYNGDSVRTAEDWGKRAREIRAKWMEMMGEWPPILTDQTFEIIETEKREDFTQHLVRFYWTPNQQTEGYLLIPDGEGAKPAVITLFYEPETAIGNGKPDRDFAYQLTKRGFVTLSLGTTETTRNGTYSLYYPGIESDATAVIRAAYAATNALEALAKVEDVTPGRIGVMGHRTVVSGPCSLLACTQFACAVWNDPGIVFDETKGANVNYWEPWYLGYYPPPWTDTWSNTGERVKGCTET